jgi:hypothetical protein
MDAPNKIYTDQTDNISIGWNGHTSQIAIDKADQNFQFFDSFAAEDLYNGATRYKGV